MCSEKGANGCRLEAIAEQAAKDVHIVTLPPEYLERTYAGVLGKLIGVYLGRPFEGWLYDRIMAELGEITGYVHERGNVPLIVTDDDISGTFTFLRALPNYGNRLDLMPQQIGQTWLNYLIENRTILWWGGLGNSTEHTAYLRLKNGIPAPQSGSIAVNGQIVAEQIGAQIFIDGWAMVSPGDPERAADLAQRAASVSHDGEAIYGAQIIAAIEAQAYTEPAINRLLDTAVTFIPHDSIIYRLIGDIRDWHAEYTDWHHTREQIVARYGYDQYGGNCHIVPNHALIIMSLLYGAGDFARSLLIVNTSGWDTDCNSGNVGCILGIRNGLDGLNSGYNWRGPIADRLYLSTAEGGSAITDAVLETYKIVNIGRALNGLEPMKPKNGARFHFELSDSVQGFSLNSSPGVSASLQNTIGHSQSEMRSLAIRFDMPISGSIVQAGTPTFIPPEALAMPGYTLIASPTLYSGQTVRCSCSADKSNTSAMRVSLYLKYYAAKDQLYVMEGGDQTLEMGSSAELVWRVPDLDGKPIAEIGLSLCAEYPTSGSLYLDYLTWDGTPNVMLKRPRDGGTMWRRAWVDATDQTDPHAPEAYRVVQNSGRGLLIQGTNEWSEYQVSATLTPHLAAAFGLGACVQGLKRYYALLLRAPNKLDLIRMFDTEQVLASVPFIWQYNRPYILALNVNGSHVAGSVDGQSFFDVKDPNPLVYGAIALIVEEGRVGCEVVEIK